MFNQNEQKSQATSFVNPLQTNNTALMIVGYVAGIAAAKLPWFDLATWNYIIFSGAGIVLAVGSAVLNRKTTIITTVANLAEVSEVQLDKKADGVEGLSAATPNNVVTK